MTLALKFLDAGAVSSVQHFAWPIPKGSLPGRWVKAEGDLRVCRNGIHACKLDEGALNWIDHPEAWVIELGGAVIYNEAERKYVARKGRLVRRLDGWNERNQRLFAADCAGKVLHLFEAKYPDDKRPREAIAAARKFARKPTESNRERSDAAWAAARAAASDAAWDAASDAARDAAWAAAWAAARAAARAAASDAAWAAASDAAWAAASDAAWDAAWAAARDAAWDAAWVAARDAAWAAARAAASDAAWDAASDAAWAAARAWQVKRLGEYLDAPWLKT